MNSFKELEIKEATTADAIEIARLHEGLLEGELTSLGRDAIALVYAAILQRSLAHINVAYVENACVGFVMIADDERRVVKNAIKSQRLKVILASNKLALAKAVISSFAQSNAENIGPTLMYIAVQQDQRGSRCSDMLLKSAEEKFRAQGIFEYALRVNAANPRALNFYFKQGFRASNFEARWKQLLLRKRI